MRCAGPAGIICETPGTYQDAHCARDPVDSAAKLDSGTGWPSFRHPVEAGMVEDS